MTRPLPTLWAALPAALLLAGCATPATQFPSLAIRDSERMSGTMAVPAAPPAPQPAPLAQAQVGAIMDRVRQGHAAFASRTAATRRVVEAARGSGVGSDAWSAAQVAVADLEGRRSEVMIALGDLDRLYVDAVVTAADATRAAEALAEANALVAEENAEIDRLLAALAT